MWHQTCVTEQREHPRGRIAVTGQELSLSSGKAEREREVFSIVGGGVASAYTRCCGEGEQGVRKGEVLHREDDADCRGV